MMRVSNLIGLMPPPLFPLLHSLPTPIQERYINAEIARRLEEKEGRLQEKELELSLVRQEVKN